jgi:glycosyltransferase involved in cell wall biosynthesis
MTKSLVVDARWLKTGIGRYTLSLLQGLRAHLGDVALTCITQPQHVRSISPLCDRVISSNTNIYTFREQLVLPWLARNASAFYAPHYNIPLLWQGRLLVTIHDLNHLLDRTYSHRWGSRLYTKPLIKRAVDRADIILTPSFYTKRMLEEHLNAPANKITVVAESVAPVFQPRDKLRSRLAIAYEYGIAQPYILFVGNLGPNKNVRLLLKSFVELRKARSDAPQLVVVSGRQGRQEMQHYANILGLEEQVSWLADVTDDSLCTLYSGAVMTIMPSLEEGFGLPVLESMACGTPVICSLAASLPEVAGNAALFFSPHSADNLVETIAMLLDSNEVQCRLIAAGLERVRNFTHKTSAILQASAIQTLFAA